MSRMLTRRSPGTEHRRYRISRGWDYDENRRHSSVSRRSFWTGCGWSTRCEAAKVYYSDAEVRTAITRMENDGLAVQAERLI